MSKITNYADRLLDVIEEEMQSYEIKHPETEGVVNAVYARVLIEILPLLKMQNNINSFISFSDAGLRLRCGELTAQEIRTVRAVLNAIASPNDKAQTRSP